MLWVVHCLDRTDTGQRRARLRPAHSAHLLDPLIRPVLVGPLLDATDEPVGSLLVLEADGREHLDAWLAEDPFTTGGVWRATVVHGFTPSTKTPLPTRP